MALANIAGRGIGYVYIIMMARKLDARYLGAYAILVTAQMLIELVSNLGLDKILIREITSKPPHEGQGFFWAALPIRFGMAAIAAAGAWFLLIYFFKELSLASPFSIALFLCTIFPVVATRNCEAYLTAHERLQAIALSQLSEKVVIFLAVLLMVNGNLTFSGVLCLAPVASLVRFSVVAIAAKRLWVPEIVPVRPNMRQLIQQSLELFSVEILSLVYFRSDVFFVAKMQSLRDAGVYQITYKIFDLCLSLFAGFLQAMFPRMVRDKSLKSLKMTLGVGTLVLMIPCGILILGRNVILGALRPEYVSGGTSLVWLMLTVPLVYITSTLVNMTIAAGKVRILIVMALILIVTNVSLNLVLIPKYSINGAAFATFASELVSAMVLAPFIVRTLSRLRTVTPNPNPETA
jgi:O-antigen/teichoic acid export membrane protein